MKEELMTTIIPVILTICITESTFVILDMVEADCYNFWFWAFGKARLYLYKLPGVVVALFFITLVFAPSIPIIFLAFVVRCICKTIKLCFNKLFALS